MASKARLSKDARISPSDYVRYDAEQGADKATETSKALAARSSDAYRRAEPLMAAGETGAAETAKRMSGSYANRALSYAERGEWLDLVASTTAGDFVPPCDAPLLLASANRILPRMKAGDARTRWINTTREAIFTAKDNGAAHDAYIRAMSPLVESGILSGIPTPRVPSFPRDKADKAERDARKRGGITETGERQGSAPIPGQGDAK